MVLLMTKFGIILPMVWSHLLAIRFLLTTHKRLKRLGYLLSDFFNLQT